MLPPIRRMDELQPVRRPTGSLSHPAGETAAEKTDKGGGKDKDAASLSSTPADPSGPNLQSSRQHRIAFYIFSPPFFFIIMFLWEYRSDFVSSASLLISHFYTVDSFV